MNLYNFFAKLRKKEVYPKLYIFNLHFSKNGIPNIANKLAVEVDYRYEDAFAIAKTKFRDELRSQKIVCEYMDLSLSTWASFDVLELFQGFIDNSLEPVKNVNTLIREIKENKRKFSDAEKLMISDILGIDKIEKIEVR